MHTALCVFIFAVIGLLYACLSLVKYMQVCEKKYVQLYD